ncbi:MAG: SpaA isopeptide-forming pilin-related protein, partial [Turicibacter sp.]|nr:SpaA isopeptide-forming pilin-related protein [Turicibacter sp.]
EVDLNGEITITPSDEYQPNIIWDEDAEDWILGNERAPVDFEFTKHDNVGSPLAGAEFQLFARNEANDGWETESLQTVTSPATGIVRFTGLSIGGRYQLRETQAPAGFELPPGYWELRVGLNGVVTIHPQDGAPAFGGTSSNWTLRNERVPANFEFTKHNHLGQPLAGARFELFARNAADTGWETTALQIVTSPANGIVRFTGLSIGGRYQLRETQAPDNFELPSGYWELVVGTNGVVTVHSREGAPAFGGTSSNWTLRNEILEPDLSIIKSSTPAGGPNEESAVLVDRNQEIIYEITVINAGPGRANNVVVEDVIPNYLTINRTNIMGHFNDDEPISLAGLLVLGVVISPNGDNQTVEWTIATLEAGESFTLLIPTTVEETAPNGYILTNVAVITEIDEEEVNLPSNEVNHIVEDIYPVLEITKSSNPAGGNTEGDAALVERGDEIVYDVTVSNTGTAVATNVLVEDVIPNYLTINEAGMMGHFNDDTPVDIEALAELGVIVEVTGQTVTWTIATLVAGETFTLLIPTTVDEDAPNNQILHNVAVIRDEDGDIPSDDVYHEVDSLYPYLTITKSSNPAGGDTTSDAVIVERGDEIDYIIVVSNTGDVAASDVEVEDVIPTYLTINEAGIMGHFNDDTPIDIEALAELGVIVEVTGQTVTWTIATLAAGETFTLLIPTTVDEDAPDGHILHNVAVIRDEDGDIPSDDVYHEVNERPVLLPPTITKTALADGPVYFGDFVTYQLVINNPNDVVLADHLVIDNLANGALTEVRNVAVYPEMTFTHAVYHNALTGFSELRVLLDLPADSDVIITFEARVVAAGEVVNTGYIFADEDDIVINEDGDREGYEDKDDDELIIPDPEPWICEEGQTVVVLPPGVNPDDFDIYASYGWTYEFIFIYTGNYVIAVTPPADGYELTDEVVIYFPPGLTPDDIYVYVCYDDKDYEVIPPDEEDDMKVIVRPRPPQERPAIPDAGAVVAGLALPGLALVGIGSIAALAKSKKRK